MPLAHTIARRIRAGVERRVGVLLQRSGLKQPPQTPVTTQPAPTITSSSPAPVLAQPAPSAVVIETLAIETKTLEAQPEPVGERADAPMLTREQIEILFEEMVRPALQSDGGDITLVKVESNDVYVELTGACQTCPSSIVTMQMGIERLLREEFPHFGQLIRVNEAG